MIRFNKAEDYEEKDYCDLYPLETFVLSTEVQDTNPEVYFVIPPSQLSSNGIIPSGVDDYDVYHISLKTGKIDAFTDNTRVILVDLDSTIKFKLEEINREC